MTYEHSKELAKAMQLASTHHKGQKYGKVPYMWHIRDVFKTWDSFFADKDFDTKDMEKLDTIIDYEDKCSMVCYLHDILEDCPEVTAEALLREGLPNEVVDAVVLVTKEGGYEYIEYIKRIGANKIAWQVKVADTHSNLTASIKSGSTGRVNKYAKQLADLYLHKNF